MAKLLFYRKYQPQNLKEMKNIFKIFGALALTITVVSCGSSNVYGDNGRVNRAPDGRVYRQGEIYRAPNGDVYRNGVLIRSGSSTVIIVDDRPQNLPPGQMKKNMEPNLLKFSRLVNKKMIVITMMNTAKKEKSSTKRITDKNRD